MAVLWGFKRDERKTIGQTKILENLPLKRKDASLSEWLDNEENSIREILLQKRIKSHLYTTARVLDEAYGIYRDIKRDLGGYIIIFYGKQKEAEEQYKRCLEEHNIQMED